MNLETITGAIRNIKPIYRYLIPAGFLIVVAAVVIILLPDRQQINFISYTSNQGGFTIDAPDGKMATKNEKLVFLDKNVVRYSHEASTQGYFFRVLHFDLPAGVLNPQERSNILNHLAAEYIQPVNGVITNTQDYLLQGYDGIRFSAKGELNDTAMMSEAVIILVSNRVYMAGVHGKEKGLKKKYIDSFIGSFRFNF